MVKRISVFCLTLCLLLSFSFINVFAYTVDDVRDLLGKERVDDIYTQEEIDEVIRQYNQIEEANMQYYLFELASQLSTNKELIAEYERLEVELVKAKEELAKSFKQGDSLPEVLKKKSRVESIMTEIDSLREIGYNIEVEYIENIWSEEYEKVQNVVSQLSTQYDIGVVGGEMKIPVNYGFYIEYPFGLKLNQKTFDSVTMHNGLDFRVPENTIVYAQWNGIVSNVYESTVGGKTIEISHGPDMKTIYTHLNSIDVSIGQEVLQYEVIGKSGNTGISERPHLHFGVFLDGEYINPIYLFGTNGLMAFKTFVSENPALDFDKIEVEENLKDLPSKVVEKEEEEIEITGIVDNGGVETKFNNQEFVENMAEWYKMLEERQKNEEYKKSLLE